MTIEKKKLRTKMESNQRINLFLNVESYYETFSKILTISGLTDYGNFFVILNCKMIEKW